MSKHQFLHQVEKIETKIRQKAMASLLKLDVDLVKEMVDEMFALLNNNKDYIYANLKEEIVFEEHINNYEKELQFDIEVFVNNLITSISIQNDPTHNWNGCVRMKNFHKRFVTLEEYQKAKLQQENQ